MFQLKPQIGEKKMQNCGLEAEIIKWRKANDIDVRFNNGVIRQHVRYSDFKRGDVKPLWFEPRNIGDKIKLKDGTVVKIIDKKEGKCVLEFPNGTIRTIETRRVKNGANIMTHGKVSLKELIGNKIFKTTCGLNCSFYSDGKKDEKHDTTYVNAIFEDGKIKYDITLCALKKGTINHPDITNSKGFNMFYGHTVKRHLQLEDNVYYGVYNEDNDLLYLATLRELIHSNLQTSNK